MTRRVLTIGLLALMFGLTGCGGSNDAPAPASPIPPQRQGDIADLLNTTWLFGDTVVAFKDASTVFVKGSIVAKVAPDGLDAAYTYKNGIIEISAENVTKAGTWDGANLVIDGQTGIKQ